MNKYLLCLFALFGFVGLSQVDEEQQEGKEFEAVVINAQSSTPLESVHVINLNKVVGTITNAKGEFSINASVNDTLYFSY